MRVIAFLSILLLLGCTTLYNRKAVIKLYDNKVEFWSKSEEFEAKVKKGDVEASYSSKKPSLLDDVIKVWAVKQIERR